MFERLLIANRGEIACRVARTARRLGMQTIAVYSDADRAAPHVAVADESWALGPAPAAESYLNAARILEIARRSGASALHPGYGFLAENADFAESCTAAGVVFVGPPAQAIRVMGHKSAAKQRMEQAGVPVIPGYHGSDQADAVLEREAKRIGFPLLIKAVAGGGGKGMRRVDTEASFSEALAAARREAMGAFGDAHVLLERWIEQPRHVEVQVFSDRHGGHVHLFERDCSLQRRHQKVVEEAPAPGIEADRREELGAAAVAVASAIGYQGAGTVEFLLDASLDPQTAPFYFMEMNTRLQVEHPVTEMITGLDLVDWQLRVAAGERLPVSQGQLAPRGHAIEARLYAEDPARDHLPVTGRLLRWRPPSGEHIRVDAGVGEGDEITPHYDPLLAKLIAWGENRDQALRRLRGALEQCEAAGLTTNLGFLAAILRHPAFAAGHIHTDFLRVHAAELLADLAADADAVLALATLDHVRRRDAEVAERAARGPDPTSPWDALRGFRLHLEAREEVEWRTPWSEGTTRVGLRRGGADVLLELPGGTARARLLEAHEAQLDVELDGRRLRGLVVPGASRAVEREVFVQLGARGVRLVLHDPRAGAAPEPPAGGAVRSPMPGKVLRVLVSVGTRVERGQPLLILEAMKMEHTLRAGVDGSVVDLNCREGDQVEEGVVLLLIEPSAQGVDT
jgi:3-methylcrotonyl-CoA carboxylase alpha subunit